MKTRATTVISFFLPVLLVILLRSAPAHALIFENDDRLNLFEINKPEITEIARSTFTFIEKENLIKRPDGRFEFKTKRTYGEYVSLCERERFFDESSPGTFCTGYLVGSDVGVTAGHCVEDTELKTFCSKYYIVFDYMMNSPGQVTTVLPASSVQTCQSILAHEYDGSLDYTVLRFKEPLRDRKPLRYRKTGSLTARDSVFTLGYPKGLPLKVSLTEGKVSEDDGTPYFSSQLSAMHGNSGGPVINSRTLEVEGHLVRYDGSGWPSTTSELMTGDFEYDSAHSCYRTWICRASEGCDAGDSSFRITKIRSVLDRFVKQTENPK